MSTSKEKLKQLAHIPGSNGLPLLGNTLSYVKDTWGFHRHYYQTYGPVARMTVFGLPTVMFYSADGAEKLLFDKTADFSSAGGYAQGKLIFPRGLLLRDGENHLFHRRIMQAAFLPKALKGYIPTMNKVSSEYLDHYEQSTDTLFYPDVKQYLLKAACRVFMDIAEEKEVTFLVQHYITMINGFLFPIQSTLPGMPFRKALDARQHIVEYFMPMVAKKKGIEADDMFTILCNATDEDGNTFTDDEVVDHMNFLMFAAHDTLSGQLSAMVYELAMHPEWQEKLREECMAISDDPAADLTYDDLSKMVSTELAIKESLRLLPPVPFGPRVALKSFEVHGIEIPAETRVNFHNPTIHRNPEFYTNPDTFDPYRFSPERAEHNKHIAAYIPFGGGPHRCIGMNYAMILIKTTLFQLLRRYQVSVKPGYEDPFNYLGLLQPKDKLPIHLERLSKS